MRMLKATPATPWPLSVSWPSVPVTCEPWPLRSTGSSSPHTKSKGATIRSGVTKSNAAANGTVTVPRAG